MFYLIRSFKFRTRKFFLVLISVCSLLGLAVDGAAAVEPIKILSDAETVAHTPLPDFSYAGYGFGLMEIPPAEGKVFNVTDYGAIPGDLIDDSKAIVAALDAAHQTDGPVVVRFPPGRLILSEVLRIQRSHIVLQGAGMGKHGTELFIPRPLNMVDRSESLDELRSYITRYDKRQRDLTNNIDVPFSEYSWSGGFIWIQKPDTRPVRYLKELDQLDRKLTDLLDGKRGSRRVKVAKPETLQVGQVVQLQWYNRQGQDGALVNAIYGDTDLSIGSHHWSFPDRPLVTQATRIESIVGEAVVLGDPLLHDISKALPAQMSVWGHLAEVGVQDMHIRFPDAPSFGHHVESGYNGIYFTSVFNGWIRSVQVSGADSAILTENSASLTFADIRTTGERRAHYPIYLGSVHNVLVKNLQVYNPTVHTLTFNTRSTRSVYLQSEVFRDPTLDQHAGSNHQNLFDQVTAHISTKRDEKGPYYALWDGSGAKYWQPGHGRFNTTWNVHLIVHGGALPDEPVRLVGAAEGPDARVVGVYGNRDFSVDYSPRPYMEGINQRLAIPSLYQYQLNLRSGNR